MNDMPKFWDWMIKKDYAGKYGDGMDLDVYYPTIHVYKMGFMEPVHNPTKQMILGYYQEYLMEYGYELNQEFKSFEEWFKFWEDAVKDLEKL